MPLLSLFVSLFCGVPRFFPARVVFRRLLDLLIRCSLGALLGSSFGLDGFQFATFFTISMPVDRTPAQIDYQNSLIERDRRTREIATLRKRIADDVRRAIRQRERVIRNLAAAEASVDIARREVEVAQLRYERGLSNNLDVVTAEGNLLATESRRISALAESAVAHLAVRATLGILEPLKDIVAAP